MQVKKVIKRIIALGAGATMLGATMLGAMAADLGEYPSPFVKNGMFDGSLVVGDAAAAEVEDVVGAVDIAASLQYSTKTEVSTTATTSTTVSDGIAVERGSDKLYPMVKDINDIFDTTLDDSEFPVMLAEQTFDESEGNYDNTVDYDQELHLSPQNNTGRIIIYQDDDDAPEAKDYLFLDDASTTLLYNFTLDFDSAVDYDNSTSALAKSDLLGSTLNMFGQDYTISNVQLSSNRINELHFIVGDVTIWLTQDQTITKIVEGVSHEITVVDVSDVDSSTDISCGVSVDGDVVWIDKDDTETINGVTIGVTDAKAVHAQLQDVDICELSIGANELKLKSGKEIEMNGADVDGSKVYYDHSTSESYGGLDAIHITYRPKDEMFLAEGDSWVDPVFGAFKMTYAGLVGDYAEINFERSGDRVTLTFPNNDGKEVEMDFQWKTNRLISGRDTDEYLLFESQALSGLTSLEDIEGHKLAVTTSGEEVHILEIQDVDLGTSGARGGTGDEKDTIDFKDETYGKTYDDVEWITADTLDLGTIGTITLTDLGTHGLTATNIDMGDDTLGTMFVLGDHSVRIWGMNESNGGATETLIAGTTAALAADTDNVLSNASLVNISKIAIVEDNDDREIGGVSTINVSFAYDATNKEIDMAAPGIAGGNVQEGEKTQITSGTSTWYDEDASNNDDKWTMTEYGTKIRHDAQDLGYVTIHVPDKQAYGKVFVSPVAATVSSTSADGTTYVVNKINVGAAKLASEIADYTAENLIVVGGPCVNPIAAKLMGSDAPLCGEASGLEEGKAVIRMYETGAGKVAIMVAGWSALDTRRGTRVLSDHAEYALSGSEVEVTGTSLTQIDVSMPQ